MKTTLAVIFLGAVCTSAVNLSHAATLNLISGASDPYNMGYVPVPSNDPIPFSSQDLLAITDGDINTGITFTSHTGEFSSQPYSVVGFENQFDFDVSQYSSIERIDFTWSGTYTWDGANQPALRFGADSSMPIATENFGTYFTPDGLVHTVTISFYANSAGFNALDYILNGDIASIKASTDLGFSTSESTITYASMQTLEVSANIVGTMVPIPATLPLLASGIGLMSLFGRRSLSTKASR